MKSLFYYLAGSCIVLTACTHEPNPIIVSQKSDEATVQSAIKPIEGLEIEARYFTVSASEASTIKLPNGGSIEFPEFAFVDKNDNQVVGNVTVEWKEFHSLTDIMLSGIPMKYDSLGVSYDFVSGGMFTIKAKKGKDEVDLAEGKTARVNLASYSDDPNFNFYEINEETGVWTYETTKAGTPLSENKQQKKETPKDELLDVVIDVSAFPELKNQHIIAWKPKDKLSAKNKHLLKTTSSEIKLEKNKDDYTISFANKKDVIKVDATPYTMKDALADKGKLMEKLETDFSEIMAFQNNLQEGKLVRSIDIPGMGTYNWDKVLKRQKEEMVTATFDYNQEVNPDFVSLYFVSPKENVAICCNPKKNKIKFDPTAPNYLVAIMPDNSILIADNTEFKNACDKESYTFNFYDLDKKVSSPQELGEVLQELMKKNA